MAYSNFGSTSYVELGLASASDSIFTKMVVIGIATNHKKTAAQILLSWGVQNGTTVIPKTTKKDRLLENADIFDFELSYGEMDAISKLNQNKKYNDPGVYCINSFKCFHPIYE